MLERTLLATYLFADDDIVVVLGQDGLVANTLKYLNAQSVVAINPIPDLYDGVLLPFYVPDTAFDSVLIQLSQRTIPAKKTQLFF